MKLSKGHSLRLVFAIWWVAILSSLSCASDLLPFSEDALGNSFSFIAFQEWRQAVPGMEVRTIDLARPGVMTRVTLWAIRLDLNLVQVEVLDAARFGRKRARPSYLRERAGALGVINASFFDESHQPLGYVWRKPDDTEGHRLSEPMKRGIFNGFFSVDASGRTASIDHRSDFSVSASERDKISLALQSGPLIIREGKPRTDLQDPRRVDRRSVIGVDSEGRVIIACTELLDADGKTKVPAGDGLSWRELQLLFLTLDDRQDMRVTDLLNLDGGSSASLSIDGGEIPVRVDVRGYDTVPIGLGWKIRKK